jgi:hypothetical protein
MSLEHTPLRQLVLDPARPTGIQTEHRSSPAHPKHQVAGKGAQHLCAGKGQDSKHETTLKRTRMPWLGYLVRIDDSRIPKDPFFSFKADTRQMSNRKAGVTKYFEPG